MEIQGLVDERQVVNGLILKEKKKWPLAYTKMKWLIGRCMFFFAQAI